MFGPLIWASALLALGCGLVSPVARWLASGRVVRSVVALVAFAALASTAHADDGFLGADGACHTTFQRAVASYCRGFPASRYDSGVWVTEYCFPSVMTGEEGSMSGVVEFHRAVGGVDQDAVVYSPMLSFCALDDAGTSVSLKPFDMSAEDGALISAAVLGVWLAAWGIRAVIDTLRDRKDGD